MYKETKQTTIFSNPAAFAGAHLDPGNRWVEVAQMVPWDSIERKYAANFKVKDNGRPALPARYALASHLVKEKYGLSDEETVEMIRENPYLQFLLGLEGFTSRRPFEASTMVWFRKRMTPEMIAEVNDYIIAANRLDDDDDDGGGADASAGADVDPPKDADNKGTLILDATCCPVDMRFPTDVLLLNEAREKLEGMIDRQHEALGKQKAKPRTYRKVARKDYLRFARARRRSGKLVRAQIRRQLGYVRRDIAHVKSLGVGLLTEKEQGTFSVIEKLYEQQKEMHDEHKHSVHDRIVSLWRPYARPIKRGKETADTEFGPKVTISMVDGDARVERFSWDNYNETGTLAPAVERFRARTGRYPERVLADRIFRTRENLAYCKMRGIRMSGPALGRPPTDKALYREQCLLERAESGERNAVEGEFGVAKRRYSLDRIMMRLKENCETQVQLTFLSMNIWRRVRCKAALFFALARIAVFGNSAMSGHGVVGKKRILAASI